MTLMIFVSLLIDILRSGKQFSHRHFTSVKHLNQYIQSLLVLAMTIITILTDSQKEDKASAGLQLSSSLPLIPNLYCPSASYCMSSCLSSDMIHKYHSLWFWLPTFYRHVRSIHDCIVKSNNTVLKRYSTRLI